MGCLKWQQKLLKLSRRRQLTGSKRNLDRLCCSLGKQPREEFDSQRAGRVSLTKKNHQNMNTLIWSPFLSWVFLKDSSCLQSYLHVRLYKTAAFTLLLSHLHMTSATVATTIRKSRDVHLSQPLRKMSSRHKEQNFKDKKELSFMELLCVTL